MVKLIKQMRPIKIIEKTRQITVSFDFEGYIYLDIRILFSAISGKRS